MAEQKFATWREDPVENQILQKKFEVTKPDAAKANYQANEEIRKKRLNQKRNTPTSKSQRASRGGVLRYPYQALTAHTDYLQIDIVEYKSVKQSSGSLISNPSSGNRRIQGSKVVGGTRPRGLATIGLLNNGSIFLTISQTGETCMMGYGMDWIFDTELLLDIVNNSLNDTGDIE